MKILFLDFDGPMMPGRSYLLPENYRRLVTRFDPVASAMVQRLLEDADARLVISSTWRAHGRDVIAGMLLNNQIDSSRLHEDWRTSHHRMSASRASEIQEWLARHPETTHWVALDDDVTPEPGGVKCSFVDGLLDKHYRMAQELLGVAQMVVE